MPSRRVVILLGLSSAAALALWVAGLFCAGPYEYAENDTATWIWMVRHGEPLYAPASGLPMRSSNYPPLYLHLVAALAPADAAILVTGRLVSLAGFLLGLGMVALVTARLTGSRRAGAVAALLVAGTFRVAFWGGLCRADGFAFGLGCAGVALASLRVRLWWLLGGLAFALSLLAKHSLVVFPSGVVLAGLLDPEARPGVRRGTLALAALTGGLVGAVLLRAHLYRPLVENSQAAWHLLPLLRHLGMSVAPSAPAIALGLGLVRERAALPARVREGMGPWAGVLLVGLFWTLSLGRTGADFNYVIELATAAAVLATTSLWLGRGRRWFSAQAGLAALESMGWVAAYLVLVLPARHEEALGARALVAAAPAALGDGVGNGVLAEQAWYATSADRPPLVIPFLAAQMAAGGRWDPEPLVAAARAGRIGRVLLGFPLEVSGAEGEVWHDERFPPGLLEALRGRYRLIERVHDLHVYAPR